jgi:iron(III) transport system substrate-binding protein
MKTKLFVLLAVILVASLMLGCAQPTPAPTPAPSPAPSPQKPEPAPPPAKPTPSQLEQIIAQAKEEGEVVISGSNAHDYERVLEGFKDKYPFIQLKGMTTNTAKTVNRVMMEAKAGRVSIDVFGTSDDGGFALAKEGVLQKPALEFPHLRDFVHRTKLQPSSGLFVVLSLTPRTQGVYNTDLVPPDEVPTSWEEMADLKWKGQTIVSSSSEELPGRLAYLWRKDGEMDWERSLAFWEKLFQQEPLITTGFSRGGEQVAAGERAVFWFRPPGKAVHAHLAGAPIDMFAFPTFISGFRSVGIIKGAPHPAAAWLLIDYLTSPQGQWEYSDLFVVLPLNPKTPELSRAVQHMMAAGGGLENSQVASPDYTLDAMA